MYKLAMDILMNGMLMLHRLLGGWSIGWIAGFTPFSTGYLKLKNPAGYPGDLLPLVLIGINCRVTW